MFSELIPWSSRCRFGRQHDWTRFSSQSAVGNCIDQATGGSAATVNVGHQPPSPNP